MVYELFPRLEERNWQVDVVFSHTCPLKYEPVEVFLPGIDQSTVDKSTRSGWTPSSPNSTTNAGTAATTTPGSRSTKCNSCSRTLTRCLFVYKHGILCYLAERTG